MFLLTLCKCGALKCASLMPVDVSIFSKVNRPLILLVSEVSVQGF